MVRAFIAVDLDERFLREATALADALRPQKALSRARWVHADLLHVTLRFLGDIEVPAPELEALVARLGTRSVSELKATALVAFPDSRRARVLGLHLEDDGALAAMAAGAERSVRDLGFPHEDRRFVPHLTFARLREPADLRRLIAEQHVTIPGRLVRVCLYQSDLGPSGPKYTPIAHTDLA